MKIKNLLASALAIAMLIGCDNDRDDPVNRNTDFDIAYVSVTLKTPSGTATRSSIENPATEEENVIKSMYAVAFDEYFQTVQYDTDPTAIPLKGITEDGNLTEHDPEVFKVSSKAKYLLIVANPGTKLEDVLTGLYAGIPFNTFNTAITLADATEVQSSTNGFAMINVGTTVENDMNTQNNAELCLIDISGNMAIIGDENGQFEKEDDAIDYAKNNRVTIKIERITSRVIVDSDITDGQIHDTKVLPANEAIFYFDGWVLDVVNTTYYPWAKTVKLDSEPTTTTFYENNFYTIDPNYEGFDGLKYNKLKKDDDTKVTYYEPDVTFLGKQAGVYCLENTMKAINQQYQNATRVIIQARYFPDVAWDGKDWFSFAGTNYESLEKLQDAYDIKTNTNLIAACDLFFAAVQKYATNIGSTFNATNFKTLTPEDLVDLTHGGEAVKEDGCIKWYKGGRCYYYYEIRHDDIITGTMAFAKYGVVRNNIYSLMLNSVKKAGTPWYPNVDPGDGDPDDPEGPKPPDPIDETEGYIGVTVEIGPWIRWQHPIDL